MTDEKKELPWNNALSILRPALLNTPERVIKYLHGFVLVPEPEAKQLFELRQKIDVDRLNTSSIVHSLLIAEIRALQERVKKFEEVTKRLLDLHHLTQFTTEQKNRPHAHFIEPRIDRETQSKLCDIFDLFREAMGEK